MNQHYPQGYSETNPHAMPPPAQHAATKKPPTWAVIAFIVGGLILMIFLFTTPNTPEPQKLGTLPNVVSTPTPAPVAKPTPIAPRTKEVAPAVPVNPASVRAGQSFVVNGKQVLSGWKLKDSYGYLDIHAKVKNVGDGDTVFATVSFKFVKGNEIVMTATCLGGNIEPGRVTLMDCLSGDKFTKDYDTIEVEG